ATQTTSLPQGSSDTSKEDAKNQPSSDDSKPKEPSSIPSTDEFTKDLPTLHETFKKEVMVKLIPEVADLADQIRFQGASGSSRQPPAPQNDGRPSSRGGVPDRDDPLRVPG